MEWYLLFLFILGGLLILMLTGMPLALAFILVSGVGMFFLAGVEGVRLLVPITFVNMARFILVPIILFIFMGVVIFKSGVGSDVIGALDMWLGRLPGRLGLLAIGSGALLGTLTGSGMSATAILGSALVPEMEKRGYKKPMSLGPILGSGGLAIMIPPSAICVFVGAIAGISIGKLLMAIIIPGLLMAVLYAIYTIGRCQLQPSIAPPYEVPPIPLSRKLVAIVKYVLPLSVIVFLVTGVIFFGIATPSEAAGTGSLGVILLAAALRRLTWGVAKAILVSTVEIAGMLLLIMVGAYAFANVLAFSGATQGLVKSVMQLPVAPIAIFVGIQFVGLLLGMFITPTGIIVLICSLFMPLVRTLGFDPVWFGTVLMLNIEMAGTTPPFGSYLFIMKGVAPPDTTMGDIIRAAVPYLICDAIAMALMIAFPQITLWLPSAMWKR